MAGPDLLPPGDQDPINILLVDDSPANLIALEAVLSSPCYRLFQANSGGEALSLLLREEFAVVLLDVQMPEMDGYETAALIRQRPTIKATPIIFITAVYGQEDHIGQGYAAGAVDYIVKPFEPMILKSKVAVFAELYRKGLEIKKQAGALVREREERAKIESVQREYSGLLNWLDHSIIWQAEFPETRFSFVSKRAVELLGYPLKRWFSDSDFFFKFVPEEDHEKLRKCLDKAIESGEDHRIDHRMIAADGKIYWYHTGIQLERDQPDRKARLRGITVDITPLKMEQEALREREAKFRRVVESNMLGHIFGDLSGRITDANDRFLDVVGYRREDILSSDMRLSDLTPPEFQLADQKAIQELKTTGVCSPYEKNFIRKDGSQVPVMIGFALLESSDNEFVAFVLDMTESHETEEEKSRAIRAREELLEIVSHDLKNPLGAILMNAALLYRKFPTKLDPQSIRKQIDAIQRSAERMKHLIEDLLDLAKIEAGRLIIEKKAEPVGPLLDQAVELFGPLAEQKRIRIEREVGDIPESISCDHERILQVFSNVLGNAIKFTPEEGTISLKARFTGSEFQFAVSDTGPGVPKDHLEHIFDRYWQVKQTSTAGGLGLGLSISRAIIERHGGRIWAESKIGHGTTIQFTVPLAA